MLTHRTFTTHWPKWLQSFRVTRLPGHVMISWPNWSLCLSGRKKSSSALWLSDQSPSVIRTPFYRHVPGVRWRIPWYQTRTDVSTASTHSSYRLWVLRFSPWSSLSLSRAYLIAKSYSWSMHKRVLSLRRRARTTGTSQSHRTNKCCLTRATKVHILIIR